MTTIANFIGDDSALLLLDDAAVLSAAAYDGQGEGLPRCTEVSTGLQDFGANWKEETDWSYPAFSAASNQLDVSDLFFRVWRRVNLDGSVTVAVAFRGTRVTNLRDWYANLRYVTRFIPNTLDHYDELRDVAPQLLAAIEAKYPTADVISTGHSLGGGLAQAFAYRSCGKVRTVFAFNPSVVTDKVEAGKRCELEGHQRFEASIEDTKIYRVFERGEVLFYPRWLFEKWRPLTKQIRVVKYNLRGGVLRPVGEHSMAPLACGLVQRHAPHERQGAQKHGQNDGARD